MINFKTLKRFYFEKRDPLIEARVRKSYENSKITHARKNTVPVTVSLTSYGKRLDTVHLTIESMFNQSRPPEEIVLWLGEDEARIAAGHPLDKQCKRGLEIRYVKDLGPFTKIIHALKEQTDKPIITIDDDILYPNYIIESLYQDHISNPKAIYSYRAHQITLDKDGKLLPYNRWKWCVGKPSVDSSLIFPTGVGGVLYPPNSLSEKATDEGLFGQLCPRADDVWLKAMSLLKGTQTLRASAPYRQLPLIRRTQSESLMNTNVLTTGNDPQIKAVFDYFGLYEKLERNGR